MPSGLLIGFESILAERGRTGIRRSADLLRSFRSRSSGLPMAAGLVFGDREDMRKRSHDTPAVVRKVHELEHVADVGESDETPLILLGEVWVVSATAVFVFLAIALLAYRLAS
jgi:hypothetical protein